MFSNAVGNLKFPEFSDFNPIAESVPHPISKAILEYKNHPSIIAIKNAKMDYVKIDCIKNTRITFWVPRDLYLVRLYLTFFIVISFLLTTTQFMIQVKILMRSYFPCKNLLKNFLNGSLIIKWKLMRTNVI